MYTHNTIWADNTNEGFFGFVQTCFLGSPFFNRWATLRKWYAAIHVTVNFNKAYTGTGWFKTYLSVLLYDWLTNVPD